jgi:flagellar hook protein FlgE
MIRSLYSGVSGMKNHQVRMDVIGNNIANVNTVGFKSGRANFQDTLYQMLRSASAGGVTDLGGLNPSQIGLGMSVSSISNMMGQGNMQLTGRTLDLAVQGNGWFSVSDGTNTYYTREGVFYIDSVGDVVNSNGYHLLDSGGTNISLGANGVATLSISQGGVITGTDLTGADLTPATIGLGMFLNQEGLERVGQNLFRESVASGTLIGGALSDPATNGYGTVNSGYLEMSNVDLTEEFTNMIVTQRGYQANARTITTSDAMLEELLNIKR